jgi:flagellar hook-associated protein 2
VSTSSIQFSGVVSGLDTSAIIQAMLAADQAPITQLQRQSATLSSQQAALNQLSADATALQQAIQALTLQSNVGAKVATTDTPTGSPPIVTATAGSSAANGSFQVTVKQLATSTRVTSSSPDGTTPAAIGAAVNLTAPLASAGFGTAITTGSFTINGKQITIDSSTVLDDPSNPDSLVTLINNAGAGVTASVVSDAYGRPNAIRLVSSAGTPIQLGSSSDTSNFLSATGLLSGAVVGYTATTVTGSSVASGALSATITIDGKTVTIDQSNGSYTSAQNAAYIVQQLNAAGLDVTASVTGAGSDQIQLTQNTPGSQQVISVSVSGPNAAAVGLTNGTYQNGTDAITTLDPLGEINPSQSLSTQQFATPLQTDASGGGVIQINGVQVTWSAADSLNNVISKINASGAGVIAAYDPLTDRVTLSASQTGGSAISMEDVSGNLLQSLHLLTNATTSVPQQLGQNAVVNISGVNNGQDIVTASNTLSNVVPGVTLTLDRASTTPVTVTISQDTTTTISTVQSFVNAVNHLFDDIDKFTATNPDPSQAGVLTADPSIEGIEDTLRTLISSPVLGGTPGYTTLSSIGISTGAIGSAPGTTNRLQLDTTKLTAALQNNPNAVVALFAGLQGTVGAVTQTTGTGNFIAGATGTPLNVHQNGTYVITVDASGNATVEFDAADGRVLDKNSGVLVANSTNASLIPGVTLTTGATVQPGTFQIPVTWTQVGAAVTLNDYLRSLTDPINGLFAARNQEIGNEQQDISARIDDLQELLNTRQQGLEQQFAQLEAILAQLQMQSSQLGAQILGMTSSSSSAGSSTG